MCAYIQPYPSTSTLGRKRSLNIHNVCPSPRSDYKHILITVSSFFTAALSLKKLSRRGTKNGEGQSLERQDSDSVSLFSMECSALSTLSVYLSSALEPTNQSSLFFDGDGKLGHQVFAAGKIENAGKSNVSIKFSPAKFLSPI